MDGVMGRVQHETACLGTALTELAVPAPPPPSLPAAPEAVADEMAGADAAGDGDAGWIIAVIAALGSSLVALCNALFVWRLLICRAAVQQRKVAFERTRARRERAAVRAAARDAAARVTALGTEGADAGDVHISILDDALIAGPKSPNSTKTIDEKEKSDKPTREADDGKAAIGARLSALSPRKLSFGAGTSTEPMSAPPALRERKGSDASAIDLFVARRRRERCRDYTRRQHEERATCISVRLPG